MTIKQAFNFCKQQLIEAGVDDPAFDAVYLFEHVFSLSRAEITIYADREVCDTDYNKLCECVDRRATGEPVQYIIGKWYFMDNTYFVSHDVLIPRDDTQVLVDACADIIKKKNYKTVLDLCSGSGIIAITIKKLFPHLDVYAVEKSDTAFEYLCKNSEHNNAQINKIHSDLYECYDSFEKNYFDLIVSNPPYIITDEIKTLQKEVQFEPALALDGGEDGYDFYKGIIKYYTKKLRIGGHIAFEIGEGQFEFIKNLLLQNGFCDVKGYLDLGNTIRAMTAVYNP